MIMQCTVINGKILAILACGAMLFGGMRIAKADPPELVGLDQNKPIVIPLTVQAAYNDDTMFFNIQYDGNRGDTHDLLQFTNGAWQKDSGSRRDGQSTLDNDPSRGPTNVNAVNYESRVTWMINDPNGAHAVPNFDKVGCFATCHDNNRYMPKWNPSEDLTKYLRKDQTADNPDAMLDLWHHRMARSNPIGMSDDQHVIPTDGTGGRKGDTGGAPWETNQIVDGHPTWVLDPADASGRYAFDFDDTHFDPDHNFMQPGDTPPISITQSMDWADAEAAGYVPQEGDTVPRRRLRDRQGTSRGDITAVGTTIESLSDPADPEHGLFHYDSSTQRLLDTGNDDDVALADGGSYDIAFAVHSGLVNARDHYVTFPMKLSLGEGGDVAAQKIPGSGSETLPDWGQIPETSLEAFLPGITTMEFLLNEDADDTFQNADGSLVTGADQVHGGAGSVGNVSCTVCHTVTGGGMSMENLAAVRGGVWTPTPLAVPEPATIVAASLLLGLLGLGAIARRRRQR